MPTAKFRVVTSAVFFLAFLIAMVAPLNQSTADGLIGGFIKGLGKVIRVNELEQLGQALDDAHDAAKKINPLYKIEEETLTEVVNKISNEYGAEVGGPILAEAIREAKRNAIAAGVLPIPPHIHQKLSTYFPRETLQEVRYRSGGGREFTLPRKAFNFGGANAITLDNIIVFKSSYDAENNDKLWAHEIAHVLQYKQWGILDFAKRYIKSFTDIEKEAVAESERYSSDTSRNRPRLVRENSSLANYLVSSDFNPAARCVMGDSEIYYNMEGIGFPFSNISDSPTNFCRAQITLGDNHYCVHSGTNDIIAGTRRGWKQLGYCEKVTDRLFPDGIGTHLEYFTRNSLGPEWEEYHFHREVDGEFNTKSGTWQRVYFTDTPEQTSYRRNGPSGYESLIDGSPTLVYKYPAKKGESWSFQEGTITYMGRIIKQVPAGIYPCHWYKGNLPEEKYDTCIAPELGTIDYVGRVKNDTGLWYNTSTYSSG